MSEGFSVVYADIEGEMVVGGVFLRLFVANPGWVLRKPKEFMTELLEKWSEIVSISNPNVRHMPYEIRITQCYLPPNTSEHTPQPDRPVLDLPTPKRVSSVRTEG